MPAISVQVQSRPGTDQGGKKNESDELLAFVEESFEMARGDVEVAGAN